MNVILLWCNHQYVSATHVVTFRVVTTEYKYSDSVSQHHSSKSYSFV